MSISGALSNALSGLNASSRAAELVSSNVANSKTEGYGARSLELSTRTLGGAGSGVRIEGVLRRVDEVLVGDRRLSDAAMGYYSAQTQFQKGVEQLIGVPGQAGSLSGRIAQLGASLIEAASRPDSEARLAAVLNAANNLTSHLKSTSEHIQESRLRADQSIATQVSTLNSGLRAVQSLNVKIQEATARGVDPSGLMDLRQMKVDELSPIIPMKQLPRESGSIALITTGGAVLLDGKPSEFAFSAVNTIVPETTVASGALSGLRLNGQSIETAGDRSLIAGGSLAGQFLVRDEAAVTAQERIDGLARDLVERFQVPAVDATRALGSPGLFTDAGSLFDPTNEVALSTRLRINTSVDPDQGGALWKIRDGLGAASQGDVGSTTVLNQLIDALNENRAPASSAFAGTSLSSAGLAGEVLSLTSTDRLQADSQLGFASAQYQSLRQLELSKGVDTDAEMQKLMQIEQAYAANARVISTANEMIQTILSI